MTYNEYIENCLVYMPELIEENNEWHNKTCTYEINGINKGDYAYTLLTVYDGEVNESINLVIPYLITLEIGELDAFGIKRVLREMLERFFNYDKFEGIKDFPNMYPYIEELDKDLKLIVEQDKEHDDAPPSRIAENSPVNRQMVELLRVRAAEPRKDIEYLEKSYYIRTVLCKDKVGRVTASAKRDVKNLNKKIKINEEKLTKVNKLIRVRGLSEKNKRQYEKLKKKYSDEIQIAESELLRRKLNMHVGSLGYRLNRLKVSAVNNLVLTVFFIKYVVRKGRY